MLCLRKIPVAKKVMEKKGEGLSQFSVKKNLSHNTEIFRRGTILCCVSEKIWWQKSVRIRRWA